MENEQCGQEGLRVQRKKKSEEKKKGGWNDVGNLLTRERSFTEVTQK